MALREKCPYSELSCSAFSRFRTEYGERLRISPYLVQMRENTDQSNSEYGHFLRSVKYTYFSQFSQKNYWINIVSQEKPHSNKVAKLEVGLVFLC